MSSASFIKRHSLDGMFWLLLLILAFVAIGIGFGEPVGKRFAGTAEYEAPWALVVHVWAMGAWIALLAIQAWLVSRRNLALHRRLGQALLALVPVILVAGFWSEVISERFYERQYADYVRFLPVPLVQLGGFGAFAALAWRARTDPPAHKRYIFLATASVLSAATGRAWGEEVDALMDSASPLMRDFFGYHFGFLLIGLAAIAYDYATRAAVHRVLAVAVPATALAMLVTSAIGASAWWPDFARALLGIRS